MGEGANVLRRWGWSLTDRAFPIALGSQPVGVCFDVLPQE